jgi:hypothetical protein
MHRRKNQFPSTIHLLPNENYYIFMFKLNESAFFDSRKCTIFGTKRNGRRWTSIVTDLMASWSRGSMFKKEEMINNLQSNCQEP